MDIEVCPSLNFEATCENHFTRCLNFVFGTFSDRHIAIGAASVNTPARRYISCKDIL